MNEDTKTQNTSMPNEHVDEQKDSIESTNKGAEEHIEPLMTQDDTINSEDVKSNATEEGIGLSTGSQQHSSILDSNDAIENLSAFADKSFAALDKVHNDIHTMPICPHPMNSQCQHQIFRN